MSGLIRKPLRGALHELWLRCDICKGSGPLQDYVQLGRSEPLERMDVCWACYNSTTLTNELARRGWVKICR